MTGTGAGQSSQGPRLGAAVGERLAIALATVGGNLFLVAGSALLGLAATVLGYLPPRGTWALLIFRFWSASLLAASGVRVAAEHAPELVPGRSYVFLSNHQSLYDIPVLLSTAPGRLRMVAKRSLFRVPLFGWALTAGGFVPVDRGDRSTAGDTFSAARLRLASGASLLLFPEGTRSRLPRLLPFQRGGFLIALKSGLPIVPVGITGTREIRRRGGLAIHPGRVVVRYGRPIDTTAYGVRRKRELIAEVRRQVAALAELESDPEDEA